MKPYQIPKNKQTTEQTVKKSQFICSVRHCSHRDHADQFIREIQILHPSANHNCWAYIAGAPDDPSNWAMSDDGEPKGCAGKPMFNVLQHSGIGEICVVISRYFGGIKLGTGGMARAYSSTVQQALEKLNTITKYHYQTITLELPYSLLRPIENILTAQNAVITAATYEGAITLTVNLREDSEPETLNKLSHYYHQGLFIEKHK